MRVELSARVLARCLLVTGLAVAAKEGGATQPTDLGTLGGVTAWAIAINDAGQVAGQSDLVDGTRHAFSWTQAGGMIDLGTLGGRYSMAEAINGTGQVVGEGDLVGDRLMHAFSWTPSGGIVDLGTLGGTSSSACCVNDSGQVVGDSSLVGDRSSHAFLWTSAGGMVDLGTLGGPGSGASAVNASGQVVGAADLADGTSHAFSWTQAGGMVDLGTLGGAWSWASGVNDSGQVVGVAYLADGTSHAFSWTQAGGMVDLATSAANTSRATGVNNRGQVVGEIAFAGSNRHAFSWTQAGGMIDLGALGGVDISWAEGLNDNGQVVGQSYGPAGDNLLRLFSWTEGGGMVELERSIGNKVTWKKSINVGGQIVGRMDDNSTGHAALWATGAATPAGSGTAVLPFPGVQVTFGSVTGAGTTTATVSSTGAPPPAGFTVLGTTAAYVDVSTSATFSGAVEIALPFNASGLSGAQLQSLRVLHELGPSAPCTPTFPGRRCLGTGWEDVTETCDLPQYSFACGAGARPVDSANGLVYGVVDSFSTFVAALASLPPLANAGSSETVHVGRTVTLDGSGSSDPLGLGLSYAWSFSAIPAGSRATLVDPTTVHPSFTTDVMGDYVLSLTVTNSVGLASPPARVTISTRNSAPIADAVAAPQAIVLDHTVVQLGGESWDPDGDPIGYAWSFSSRPPGSAAALSGANTATPSFVVDVHGDYVVELVVSDPWTSSAPASVTISFANLPPVAVAGTGGSALVGTSITLDGSASSDPNGDPITYAWSLTSGPQLSQATIQDPTATKASLVPDLPGTYVAQLIVDDGTASSAPSTVSWLVFTDRAVVIEDVRALQQVIASLPREAFRNREMGKMLNVKLNDLIRDVQGGRTQEALDDLEDELLRKVDGCAESNPPTPGRDDWIRTCAAQEQVYPLVLDLIAQVTALR